MKAKKFFAAAAGAAMAFTLAACSGDGAGSTDTTPEDTPDDTTTEETTDDAVSEGGLIGVAMPTQTLERWIADGDAVKEGLEDLGYEVDLQYANDDIPTQGQQIEQMITNGGKVLIIAAVDGTALAPQLAVAGENGIKVIGYDRLLQDTENIDFYVTFDNYNVGMQQANSVLVGLGLLNEDLSEGDATGPFNIELFAGSLDDNNAHFFWQGAMDVLQPYFDDGTLTVPSGQMDIEQAATQTWQAENAQSRMEDLLTSTYTGTDLELDAVLAPNDGIARAIINALWNTGNYGETIADGLPIMSGQDAEVLSVQYVRDGVQFATIFKDTRKLAAEAIVATDAFLSGGEPTPNDTETYDNGVKVVPSNLLEVDVVYSDDIEPLIIDSGYLTAEEVDAGVQSD